MERKLVANYLVPDDEVWVSPKTWERPFSLKVKESTVTDTQQLKTEIRSVVDDFVCIPPVRISEEIDNLIHKLRELSAV